MNTSEENTRLFIHDDEFFCLLPHSGNLFWINIDSSIMYFYWVRQQICPKCKQKTLVLNQVIRMHRILYYVIASINFFNSWKIETKTLVQIILIDKINIEFYNTEKSLNGGIAWAKIWPNICFHYKEFYYLQRHRSTTQSIAFVSRLSITHENSPTNNTHFMPLIEEYLVLSRMQRYISLDYNDSFNMIVVSQW